MRGLLVLFVMMVYFSNGALDIGLAQSSPS